MVSVIQPRTVGHKFSESSEERLSRYGWHAWHQPSRITEAEDTCFNDRVVDNAQRQETVIKVENSNINPQ